MANAAAKKQKIENERIIRNVNILIALVLAFHVLYGLVLRRKQYTTSRTVATVATAISAFIARKLIIGMSKVKYDANGELVDGGADLNMKGLCEYYFDVLYVSSFLLVTTCFSSFFWLLAIPVFGFAAYKIVTVFVMPMFATPEAAPESNTQKKRREREEKMGNNPRVQYKMR
eukprot:TRINITY_DN6815_c0_g1_i1.p2 TRINITY_DN6815_c0_g1~~TRINITY_DN6815_c0_g1_i1.p2  ORF type:complete len:173 (+),score=36.06 TRINITY_DN6815_c0_g1_i1:19-537(+)